MIEDVESVSREFFDLPLDEKMKVHVGNSPGGVGYAAMGEQFHPTDLVDYCKAAEDNGFNGLMISDHFHPWVPSQGHSPFAWALIRIDGAESALLHAVDALDIGNMATGMKVTPRWRDEREGHINDIECFEPEGGI